MTRNNIFIIAVLIIVLGGIPVTLYVLSRYSLRPVPSPSLQQDVVSGPRTLKIGQKANVKITGTLYKNIDSKIPMDYLIDGGGWVLYADFPRYSEKDIEPYLAEEITASGLQFHRTVRSTPYSEGGLPSSDDFVVDMISVYSFDSPSK